jgi:hypothetical protein
MYSFAQRNDTTVADEPFYALYLSKSGALHPGRAEVLASQSADEVTVKAQLASGAGKPVLFIKNMAHHIEVMSTPFIENAINIFLIRDPKQIIASYAQVIDRPVMRDIGIEYQYNLFKQLEKKGRQPVVLDSGLLLEDPRSVLEQLCHRCAIGFQAAMLAWKAGPKSYDGVWAPYWYDNVHQSIGFKKQQTSDRPLPHHLDDLYQQARGYYEKLLPFSIKA